MRKPTRLLLFTVTMAVSIVSPTVVPCAESRGLRVRMRVDLTGDAGQAWGSLWEAVDDRGRAMAGAGFLNAWNTQDRSDRRMLHVYVRTPERSPFTPERLPRSTTDAGTYLFGFDGRLFAKGRSPYMDNKVRRWKDDERRWAVDEKAVPFSVTVGGQVLALQGGAIRYDGTPVFELPVESGRLGEWYYAAGRLVVRRFHRDVDPPVNELVAFRWIPGQQPVQLQDGIVLPLSHPTEFVYAFGLLERDVVVASNRGGVHVFGGEDWRSLRTPNGRSFQVYSTLNTRGRLLLGQYPTGEIFEYADGRFERLAGWPPVMPGVRSNARELQTLAIYGGDIYAGVWPWGEIWRRDLRADTWQFVGRMFTHPQPTDKATHPYEVETKAIDPVPNRWGQRVTSMVPIGDSLYIATSAKTAKPYEPKFTFLADEYLDYGRVYRYRRSGCLAVPIAWKKGPTEFEFEIDSSRIRVLQDGQHLGEASWDANHAARLGGLTVHQGRGVYGPFRGRRIARVPTEPQSLDRKERRKDKLRNLPDMMRFAETPSDRFVVDLDDVRTGHPYKGTDANRPHTGAHVYFKIPDRAIPADDVAAFPAIYAVADGHVSRIDEYFKLMPIFVRALGKRVANHRYGVTLAIGRKDGAEVTFHYSIEPMIDPGDADFYKPFILVRRGQKVKKGDVIARMYIPPQRELARNTHIHFNLIDTGKRQFMAPTIFTDAINRRFHSTWGDRGVDGDNRIPSCMGYRLSAPENPFGTGAKHRL